MYQTFQAVELCCLIILITLKNTSDPAAHVRDILHFPAPVFTWYWQHLGPEKSALTQIKFTFDMFCNAYCQLSKCAVG